MKLTEKIIDTLNMGLTSLETHGAQNPPDGWQKDFAAARNYLKEQEALVRLIAPRTGLGAKEITDLLKQAGLDVPQSEIEQWSQASKDEAAEYAGRMIVSSTDPNVELVAAPAILEVYMPKEVEAVAIE